MNTEKKFLTMMSELKESTGVFAHAKNNSCKGDMAKSEQQSRALQRNCSVKGKLESGEPK